MDHTIKSGGTRLSEGSFALEIRGVAPLSTGKALEKITVWNQQTVKVVPSNTESSIQKKSNNSVVASRGFKRGDIRSKVIQNATEDIMHLVSGANEVVEKKELTKKEPLLSNPGYGSTHQGYGYKANSQIGSNEKTPLLKKRSS